MALPKVLNCRHFKVDSETCPQDLRLILRHDIRDVFSRRNSVKSCVLSNAGIDALIDKWWPRHQNIIRAASIRPEWDWKTLSLHCNENISRPVNFFDARKDYLVLLARPHYLDRTSWSDWNYSTERVCSRASSDDYLGRFHSLLYKIYVRAFILAILENKEINSESVFTDDDGYLSSDSVSLFKAIVDNNFVEEKRSTVFCSSGICGLITGNDDELIPFNKLPKRIFEKFCSLRDQSTSYSCFYEELFAYIDNHEDNFLSDLLKSIGAHQMAGSKGPSKTTLCNKLVKSFYDWLNATSISFSGNSFALMENYSFDEHLNHLKSFIFFTDMPLKERRTDGVEGFILVNRGSYEQIFARLQENVKSSFIRESFIVSFHPCDMITCSLGYNWSSCQSWIDDFTDLPRGYGVGSNYGGMYNRGNFQFLCANAFIVYIPHEKMEGVPQFLWAKKKRCLIWVGDNLDCMRQNYFYPGKPTDQETLAFGKFVREYIQNICAPFNFSNGTMDWKVKKGVGKNWNSQVEDEDFNKFQELYDPCCGRYDDPIMAISYLKTAKDNPTLYYALNFPKLDTGKVQGNYSANAASSFFNRVNNVCPICGKHTSHGGICPKCSKELIEHNGRMVHPSDLVALNIDNQIKYFDIDELDKLDDYVVVEDGTAVEFKSAYKVLMPSGIRYFKVLPDFVKQCKVCKEYFHPSFMVGDVCIEHFNSLISNSENSDDVVIDLDEVLKAFMSGTLSFDCNDTDNLLLLLKLLDNHGIKWVSGVNASDYVPNTSTAKKMYLSLKNKKLILSSQAKSTVVMVSNLFKKGGE